MATKKIVTVVGARPQFVKAAVVSRAISKANQENGAALTEEIIHTGQHYDNGMSQVFFDQMDIPAPAVNLNIGSGQHGETTGKMLHGIEQELLARSPDLVLLYGDTNSTLAGALAAVKLHLPVAHVEAGLRSYNRTMPEEINRIVTDTISTHLFCPSSSAEMFLHREGITKGVHVVGDVMVDALLYYRSKAIAPTIDGPFALATLHRAENTDNPARLKGILEGFRQSPIPIVLPIHPRTEKALKTIGLSLPDTVVTQKPASYFEMLGLLKDCRFVLTDSGGLQKEAYVLQKRCVTLRDETEWNELVEADCNRLVGANTSMILEALEWADTPLKVSTAFYGDGESAARIVEILQAA
ncbi:MAG: UDP-N-acetylglucosamine 2-epimerase (non-hydrolyzing) [Myxococcota bacterium]|nr:UDP-N-acetylglucosamine 2-epimerase (non-hydrolyzing) [Myxococcota bacterium]